MSDDRCPEHNCDIAACFGKHQGGTMNEAFEQWWFKTTSGVDWVSETEEQAKTHAWLAWEVALTHLHEFLKAERIDEEKLLQAFREWHLNTYFSPPSSALVIHEARWEGFRAGAKFASGFDAQEVTVTRSVRQSRKRSSKPTLKYVSQIREGADRPRLNGGTGREQRSSSHGN